MSDRLPADLEARGLMRAAEAIGGQAMVLAKGDADRGDLLLLIMERGCARALVHRERGMDGEARWRILADGAEGPRAIDDSVARRRRIDPDCWVIELDLADPAPFLTEVLLLPAMPS